MPMQNPPHPGGIIRRQCLEPLGLSLAEAAEGLGVSPRALGDVVDEKAPMSVEMAMRLAKGFGSSPETWLGLQMAYDLWQAREQAKSLRVRRFRVA
jgi:addiction module HigA family antidote